METITLELQTSKSRSEDTSNFKRALIAEWVVRFAVNADRALTAGEQSVLRSTWADAFAEIDAVRLKDAFIATLRSHMFKTIPTVGDILQHVSKAEADAAHVSAELKWQQVLAYAQSTSPDYAAKPVRIKPQTEAAIRAAGGLNWIRDCSTADLQWAKRRFIESFVSWVELEKNQFLLPDGEIKTLLAEAAKKLLPA